LAYNLRSMSLLRRLRRRGCGLSVLLLVTLACIVAPAARAESPPDSTSHRLAPTSDPPWRPERPVPSARGWETAVRAPGRIVGLPFSLLGVGMKASLVYVDEHDLVPKVVAALTLATFQGLYVTPASLGDRTGWGAEAGVHPPILRNVSATFSGSTEGYNRTQAGIDLAQGGLDYRYDWRPSDTFFGIGRDARKQDESNFASQSERVTLTLRYPFWHKSPHVRELLEDPAISTETHVPPRWQIEAWAGPRDLVTLDGRDHLATRPPVSERFPTLEAEFGTHVEHFIYGARASYDTRSGRPHWWKGWRVATRAERFDEPLRAFALHRADTPTVPFTRWVHEAETGVSFWRDPRTLRFYARVEDLTGLGSPGVFMLSDYSTLGGQAGLHGFEPGRFRDADLVLGRVTYIFPVARYLEGDVHTELGDVLPTLEDARLDRLRNSYGAALRVRSFFVPLAAFGMDWSREKVRFRFAIGGVE